MLHTINKSAFVHRQVDAWVNRVDPGKDALVFIEEGVYSVMTASPVYPLLKDFSEATKDQSLKISSQTRGIFVLSDDYKARGLELSKLPDCVIAISMNEFVELSVQHSNSLSWF